MVFSIDVLNIQRNINKNLYNIANVRWLVIKYLYILSRGFDTNIIATNVD